MLALIIAAACLWRGLTTEETDAVAAAVDAVLDAIDLEQLTAGEARDILDVAIATVLTQTRSG